MNNGAVFIPRKACTVASGDCFTESRCLRRCQTRLSAESANEELTEALHLLRELRDYTLMFRSVTHYVDGSTIDAAVKRTAALLKRNVL